MIRNETSCGSIRSVSVSIGQRISHLQRWCKLELKRCGNDYVRLCSNLVSLMARDPTALSCSFEAFLASPFSGKNQAPSPSPLRATRLALMRGSRSASSRSVVSTSRLSDAIFDNGPQDETHKASPSAPLRIEAFEGQVQRNIEEMQPLATAGSRSEALKLGEGLAENSKSSTTCVASPKPVPDTSDTSIVSACSEVILDPPVCVPEDLGPIVLDKTQKCALVDLPIGFGTARPAHQASKPSQPPFPNFVI